MCGTVLRAKFGRFASEGVRVIGQYAFNDVVEDYSIRCGDSLSHHVN